ncbi:hypothetical protein BKA93DRAFT_188918 [Sparassis latifolia]
MRIALEDIPDCTSSTDGTPSSYCNVTMPTMPPATIISSAHSGAKLKTILASVIGGVGFVTVLSVAFLLWRRWCRRRHPAAAGDGGAEADAAEGDVALDTLKPSVDEECPTLYATQTRSEGPTRPPTSHPSRTRPGNRGSRRTHSSKSSGQSYAPPSFAVSDPAATGGDEPQAPDVLPPVYSPCLPPGIEASVRYSATPQGPAS